MPSNERATGVYGKLHASDIIRTISKLVPPRSPSVLLHRAYAPSPALVNNAQSPKAVIIGRRRPPRRTTSTEDRRPTLIHKSYHFEWGSRRALAKPTPLLAHVCVCVCGQEIDHPIYTQIRTIDLRSLPSCRLIWWCVVLFMNWKKKTHARCV